MLNIRRPIRVAVLCSNHAPGLLYLLNQCPDRGVTYEIVCCVTSEFTFAEEVRVERRGVPTIAHPIDDFYEQRHASIYRDMGVRSEYDDAMLQRLAPFYPDLVLLDGYLYLITRPLLRAFGPRIVNLHFSDLTLRNATGDPKFPGIRAVRDAIEAGCRETRATVHVVDEKPDAGPLIVRSWPFPVSPLVDELRTKNASEVVKAYVYAHQQWMMRTAAGPLMAAALRLIASGAVDLGAIAKGNVSPWLLDRHDLVAPEADLVAH
jgi:folate-dependent phosphoribosylglycinamide formyltransferase PurN